MFGFVRSFLPTCFSASAHPVPSRLTSHLFVSLRRSAFAVSYLIMSTSQLATQITLAWNTSLYSNVANYPVHYRCASGRCEGAVKVGMLATATSLALEEVQAYGFAVLSYDADGALSEGSREPSAVGSRRCAHEDEPRWEQWPQLGLFSKI
jgi:hypothetical protein